MDLPVQTDFNWYVYARVRIPTNKPKWNLRHEFEALVYGVRLRANCSINATVISKFKVQSMAARSGGCESRSSYPSNSGTLTFRLLVTNVKPLNSIGVYESWFSPLTNGGPSPSVPYTCFESHSYDQFGRTNSEAPTHGFGTSRYVIWSLEIYTPEIERPIWALSLIPLP